MSLHKILFLLYTENGIFAFLFYSILFCTFIALNLCKADSKAQHQKSSLRNRLSIAVAKSSTTETPDRVYALFLGPRLFIFCQNSLGFDELTFYRLFTISLLYCLS